MTRPLDNPDDWRYTYPRIEAERFKEEVDALRQAKDSAQE